MPHLDELYARPVLRAGPLAAMGVPPPPLALVLALVAVCLGALVPLALGRRELFAWALLFPCLATLFLLDPTMSFAYGGIAVIQWGIYGLSLGPLPAREVELLLRLQWSSIYLLSVPAKLASGEWVDGTALFLALSSDAHGDFLLSAGGVSKTTRPEHPSHLPSPWTKRIDR